MFKALKRVVSGRVAAYFGLVLFQKALSVLLQPILMRQFTPAEYGVVSQYSAIFSLFVLLITFSADEIVIRKFHQHADEAGRFFYVSSYVQLLSIVALVMSSVFILVGFVLSEDVSPYIFLGLIFSTVAPIVSSFQKFLRTQRKTTHLAAFNVFYGGGQAAFIISLINFMGEPVKTYFVAQVTFQCLVGLLILSFFTRFGWKPMMLSDLGKVYKQAAPAVPYSVVGWGFIGFTTYYVATYIGVQEAGLMGAGLYLYSLLVALSDVSVSLVQPISYDVRNSEGDIGVRSRARRRIGFVIVGLLGVGAGISVCANEFIHLILPASYSENSFFTPLLVLCGAALGLGSVWTYFLYFEEKGIKRLSMISVIGAGGNIILVYLLSNFFSVLGAISALLTITVLVAFAKGYFSFKYIGCSMRDYSFIWGAFAVLSFSAIVGIYFEFGLISKVIVQFLLYATVAVFLLKVVFLSNK